MSFGAGLFEFLSTGLSVGDRVYPLALPQDAELEALVWRVVSDVPAVTHSTAQDHPAHSVAVHRYTRVQFDCYGATYDAAEALCDELTAFLVGYKGSWDDREVDSVVADVRLDDWDEGPGIWRVIQDMIIGHRQMMES